MKYLLFLFFPLVVWAQDSRWIDLEWEPVQEAREYEIQLFQDVGGKPVPRGKYKTDSPEWSHSVPPGKYFLRLRSMDKRGVPGEWTEDIPLKVRMQNPTLLRPSPGEKVGQGLVNFVWAPVEDAYQYQLIVRNASKKVVHNANTAEVKSDVYLEKLGDYEWVVLALEKGEEERLAEDLSDSVFRKVTRVGDVLEAPVVNVTLDNKVTLAWSKVRSAETYDVEFFPPPESGDKNRRFRLQKSPLRFDASRLKEGITTLTVKATAQGYLESNKSIVKLSKSGSDVELEDIIQGKEVVESKIKPTETFFSNELYMGVILSQYSYSSQNSATDTKLNQSNLTGLGLMVEWNKRPTLTALNRKFEASLLNLSSGIDSGRAIRAAYTLHKEKKWKQRKFTFGGGAAILDLPSFMGNRATDKVEVESSTSLGPDFQLGFINPLGSHWELQSLLNVSYQAFYLSSRAKGEKAFPWMKAALRVGRFYTEKQAFFAQVDYQSWSQEWSQDKSDLSGVSVNFGIKSGF